MLLVCCQLYVFEIESKYGEDYPGGSNNSGELKSHVKKHSILMIKGLLKNNVKHIGIYKTSYKVPDFVTEW